MAADDAVGIQTLATRIGYENRWMRVREDSIRRRDGAEEAQPDRRIVPKRDR